MKPLVSLCLMVALFVAGCSKSNGPAEVSNSGAINTPALQKIPTFSLTTSEYPSFSVFAHAVATGLINPEKGELGDLEKKWGVDLVAPNMVVSYDECIKQYGNLTCDASCITNMDILNPALSRPTTVLCTLSTSAGADQALSTKYASLKEAAGKEIMGLPQSVSEYMLARAAEHEGLNPDDFKLTNMGPQEAASAMVTGSKDTIVVWEPDAMNTLKKNKSAKIIASSAVMPGEIIDMLVMGNDSLTKPGGAAFANMLVDTYYTVNRRLNDPKTKEETLVGLGEKFCTLTGPEMADVLTRCQFYGTPERALEIYDSKYITEKMNKVVGFCVHRAIVPSAPSFGVNKSDARLNFDTQFILTVQKSK